MVIMVDKPNVVIEQQYALFSLFIILGFHLISEQTQ